MIIGFNLEPAELKRFQEIRRSLGFSSEVIQESSIPATKKWQRKKHRPIRCEVCGKTIGNKVILQWHMAERHHIEQRDNELDAHASRKFVLEGKRRMTCTMEMKEQIVEWLYGQLVLGEQGNDKKRGYRLNQDNNVFVLPVAGFRFDLRERYCVTDLSTKKSIKVKVVVASMKVQGSLIEVYCAFEIESVVDG
jgi:DNA-directed RNA polymerase subunit N (RpoN/RPB10)